MILQTVLHSYRNPRSELKIKDSLNEDAFAQRL